MNGRLGASEAGVVSGLRGECQVSRVGPRFSRFFDGAGHVIRNDRPEKVEEAVKKFLDEVSGEAR